MEHFAFPGNIDLMTLMTMKGWCVYSSSIFTIGESRAISHANDTGQQAQQVAGNPRFSAESPPEKIHREWRRQQTRSRSTDEGNVVKTATTNMYRGSDKILLHCKWSRWSRGNTDCRRFKKRWGDQATLPGYSQIIFFDATIGSNSYTIFLADWGEPISLYTMSNTGFYSKLYFTMNGL